MDIEGNSVQVTQENFQQEKPMISVCNLGQISKVQMQIQISHLASCGVGFCKSLQRCVCCLDHMSYLAQEDHCARLICQFGGSRRDPLYLH